MRPRKTGFDAVDTLLEGELQKVTGFPFKMITVTSSEGVKKQKRTMTTTSTTTVDEFEEMNVDNDLFKLDPDSVEISLLPAMAEGEQPEDEPEEEEKGGFMKRLKKIRKGGG